MDRKTRLVWKTLNKHKRRIKMESLIKELEPKMNRKEVINEVNKLLYDFGEAFIPIKGFIRLTCYEIARKRKS